MFAWKQALPLSPAARVPRSRLRAVPLRLPPSAAVPRLVRVVALLRTTSDSLSATRLFPAGELRGHTGSGGTNTTDFPSITLSPVQKHFSRRAFLGCPQRTQPGMARLRG